MTDTWEVDVEDVFLLTGIGVAIVGAHRGAHIRTGQSAVLVDAGATTYVEAVTVDIHSAPDRVGLFLRGVERQHVRVGQVLRGPVAGVSGDPVPKA